MVNVFCRIMPAPEVQIAVLFQIYASWAQKRGLPSRDLILLCHTSADGTGSSFNSFSLVTIEY